MSFFPLETRDIDKDNKSGQKPGPGQYLEQIDHRNKNSYAPFGSLCSKKNNQNNKQNIGPGHYSINRDLVAPSVSKYENKNIIIVKINDDGGHQFKSRTNRFNTIKETSVGPGSYEALTPQRKAKSTTLRKPKIVDKIRQINHEYYKKMRQNTLLSDQKPVQPTQHTYERVPKSKAVLNWSLNKQERFTIDNKQEYTSEEKQRALSEIATNKKKKVYPSAVFASKSIKSHLQTQIYRTNNPFKAELRKMIDYKDERPGPGSYQIPNKHDKRKPAIFQFFGSTVQRFPEEKYEENLGPGSYKINEHSPSDKRQKPVSCQKFDKQQRHSYLPTNLIKPGPGSYNLPTSVVRPSTSSKQFDKPFGSNEPRFKEHKQSQFQASESTFETTAYYREKQLKRQQELKKRKMVLEKHTYSIFASSSKRFEQDKEQNNIQLGCYDVSQQDIGARISRYQKISKQLQQCNLHKPPFLSSQSRFKGDKIQQNPHKDCWCLVKSVEKQVIEHQSPAFASGQKRTLFPAKPSAPPVGHYQSSKESMIKDSFNSRFRKKAENQIRRSNAFHHREGRPNIGQTRHHGGGNERRF